VIDYHGAFAFPVPPLELWDALEQVDHFEEWWSWLSELTLEGRGLEAGSVLAGVVAPPLPYRMRVRVALNECVRPSRIRASVHGDLEGRAEMRLEARPGGSVIDTAWTLEMMQRPMRFAARVAHPLLRWGHDRVVEATVRGFRRHLTSPDSAGGGADG
jgi:hypothetical protein